MAPRIVQLRRFDLTQRGGRRYRSHFVTYGEYDLIDRTLATIVGSRLR